MEQYKPEYKEPYTIVPFCLFQYINNAETDYRGYIGNPQLEKQEGGALIYTCKKDNIELAKWKYVRKFYAVSPMFRPIPTGMKLICVKSSDNAPFRTTDVSVNYDMFTFEPACTYFITYTEPLANTVPLFFYRLADSIFPSFTNTPPSPEWEEVEFSPIFVMTKPPNDVHFNPNNVKFQCNNGRCIPVGKDSQRNAESKSLTECVLTCNTLIESRTRPHNILEIVEKTKKSSFFSKINLIYFLVFLLLLWFFQVLWFPARGRRRGKRKRLLR